MDQNPYIIPDFPEDAFAGTANYYAKYRVPYPKALLDDLIRRAGVKTGANLLDLACGPGRVSIPLASSFVSVLAVDIEPEMIETGKQIASGQGLHHIRWLVGRAEDLEIEPRLLSVDHDRGSVPPARSTADRRTGYAMVVPGRLPGDFGRHKRNGAMAANGGGHRS
jgi:SAM-dependent methyltransferase